MNTSQENETYSAIVGGILIISVVATCIFTGEKPPSNAPTECAISLSMIIGVILVMYGLTSLYHRS